MKTLKTLAIFALLFLFSAEAVAQAPRRRGTRRPAVTKSVESQPAPQPVKEVTPIDSGPRAPIPLAIVNGESITTANIDPKVRQEVEALDARIAEARKQVLELQINTVLLETEAAKRRMSPQELYNLEIAKRVTEPTDAEIDRVIQDNRDQVAQAEPASLRQQVVNYLKGEREAQITDAFLKRVRVSNPVVNVAPANSSSLPPSAVLVTVGGRPITAGKIEERLKPIIYKLRLNSYQLAQQALDVTINDLLLIAEANRRNVPPEE